MGVAWIGKATTSPLGVNTKTSSVSRSSFNASRNSAGSVLSADQSTMRCSQATSAADAFSL